MTRIISSKFKASRRCGKVVTGHPRDSYHKRNYAPGQHGLEKRGKQSDYGLHLIEKQSIRAYHGFIPEKQFKRIFEIGVKQRGNSAENAAMLLNSRMDIVCYLMNFGETIYQARQLISHCHFKLNGKKHNIPSVFLKPGDVIEVRDRSKVLTLIVENLKRTSPRVPEYLQLDEVNMSGTFVRAPEISEVPYPFQPNFNKVVEFYAR